MPRPWLLPLPLIQMSGMQFGKTKPFRNCSSHRIQVSVPFCLSIHCLSSYYFLYSCFLCPSVLPLKPRNLLQIRNMLQIMSLLEILTLRMQQYLLRSSQNYLMMKVKLETLKLGSWMSSITLSLLWLTW
jgi:hypothetical protein